MRDNGNADGRHAMTTTEAVALRAAHLEFVRQGLAEIYQPTDDDGLVRAELLGLIEHAIINHPRSQQQEIGPSEIGTPCDRRLGFKLGDVARFRPESAAWRPTVGTATHAWLADQLVAANRAAGIDRWLSELKINVGQIDGVDVFGNTDAYDTATGTVIDFKIVGPTSLRRYKAGPGPQYRTQVHLYGRGVAALGFPVNRVAILFLPANGELSDHVWWTEPYDDNRAIAALLRASSIRQAIRLVSPAAVIPHLTATPTHCQYCPWFNPVSTDAATSCPGDSADRPARVSPLRRLIGQ